MHMFDMLGLDKNQIPDLIADEKFRLGVECEFIVKKSYAQIKNEHAVWDHMVPIPLFMLNGPSNDEGDGICHHIKLSIEAERFIRILYRLYMNRSGYVRPGNPMFYEQVFIIGNTLGDLANLGMFDPLDYTWYSDHKTVMTDAQVEDMFAKRSFTTQTHFGTHHSILARWCYGIEYESIAEEKYADAVADLYAFDHTRPGDVKAAEDFARYVETMIDMEFVDDFETSRAIGEEVAKDIGYPYIREFESPKTPYDLEVMYNSPLGINAYQEYLDADEMKHSDFMTGVEIRTTVTNYDQLIKFLHTFCQYLKNNPERYATLKGCGVHINISHLDYSLDADRILGYDYDQLFNVFERSKDMSYGFAGVVKWLKTEIDACGVQDIDASYEELMNVVQNVEYEPDIFDVHESGDLKYGEFRSSGGKDYQNKVDRLIQSVQLAMYIVSNHNENPDGVATVMEQYWD